MTVVPTSPVSDVCHEKYLNEGRKLGADAKSRPKQAFRINLKNVVSVIRKITIQIKTNEN
jgi:hypothetical protein